MNNFDKLFSKLVIGYILFVFPILLLWWSFYLFEWNILIGLSIGVVIGIILNILFLKKVTDNFYNIKSIILVIIYSFYSICIFGFFMGVPIFNILPGILAGIYIGRQCAIDNSKEKEYKKRIISINIFSSIVLLLICLCSAYIALTDKYTAVNIEGMLSLDFNITNVMLLGIIIIGGIVLLLLQYFISIKVANIAYRKRNL